jgi:serpin B
MRLSPLSALCALSTLMVAVGCAGESPPAPVSALPTAPTPTTKNDPPAISPAVEATAAANHAQGDAVGARAAEAAAAAVQADVKAANTVAIKLYRKARKGQPNVMLSGTSLRRALGATYLGARGATAREMANALELSDAAKAAALAKVERAAWEDAKGKSELVVADRVWTEKKLPLEEDFVKLAADAFGAPVEPLDFSRSPDAARKTVNAWVAEKTSNKIVDLLPSGSIDNRTRLVVTNAIYFKARWTLPFSKSATKDEVFTAAGGKRVTTPMMHETESHRFAQSGGAKVLEMRYESSDLAMLVALPDDPNGLGQLEENLTADAFEQWTRALGTQRVSVTLPKFTVRSGGPMNAPLQELGMKTAFTSNADFSGIAEPTAGERIEISQVAHQTYVAVDEIGTEAAAATGVVMRTTSLPMGPIVEFKADRPFLFFIQDTKRGRILFMGRVSDPKAS